MSASPRKRTNSRSFGSLLCATITLEMGPNAMQLSSTTTPEACFARFWNLLSAPKPEIWRQHRAAAQGPERQREAASGTGHSLAPWPKQKMEEFYSEQT